MGLFPSAASFTYVMEEDGSLVGDEDMADIIESGEKIGTVMILQNNEVWRMGKQ